MILLANVLQKILHQVLLITRIKIYRYCSTINFTEDYFRQQYQGSASQVAYNFPFVSSQTPESPI